MTNERYRAALAMLDDLAQRGFDVGQTREHLEAVQSQGNRTLEEAIFKYVEVFHGLMNRGVANDAG
jgi:hypothetical protein